MQLSSNNFKKVMGVRIRDLEVCSRLDCPPVPILVNSTAEQRPVFSHLAFISKIQLNV